MWRTSHPGRAAVNRGRRSDSGGRCWPDSVRRLRMRVAILTDPGGPVLVGVHGAVRVGERSVAILTDPGGPVLGRPTPRPTACRPRVAILTDPGGPVLGGSARQRARLDVPWLRSSPTLTGRCWLPGPLAVTAWRPVVAILTDPGGPVLGCPPPGRGPGVPAVAILTDPGGPVLGPLAHHGGKHHHVGVAILTDPGGPVLVPGRGVPRSSMWIRCCDPHRPWRAGAGPARPSWR